MKTGVQLWGVLREGKEDPFEALKKLAELGYSHIEPCIALDPVPGYEHVIWPLDWFEAHAEDIGKLGLDIQSCHIFGDHPAAHMGELQRLRCRGIRRFVVKLPAKLTDESLQETAIRYMQLADRLAEIDAELLLHNEVSDIREKIHGKTAYEHMLDLCLGRVGAQADLGGIHAGGEDVEAFLWRNASRIRSVHFKNMVPEKDGSEETGENIGREELVAGFQFARAFGLDQIVEQDVPFPKLWEGLELSLRMMKMLSSGRDHSVSYLNTLDTETGEVKVLKRFDHVIEAPNWLKKTDRIFYNDEGLMYALDLKTGEVSRLDTGCCNHCNNDHVVSPDETAIAVSHMTFDQGFTSRVYIVPLEGGAPRLVTPNSPSFLHGWSPDGKELAYCAFREIDGKREVDVYTIPAGGGEEKRLTFSGFNDGPEYSPDGQYIWFNSTRPGLMQVWRMKRDGSEQTQMTFSEQNNWFGHISPDGSKVVWISYGKNDLEAEEHLPNMQVEIWMMNSDGGHPRRLLRFFGGQGSINVNSWAGDSRHIAFVSYELLHK